MTEITIKPDDLNLIVKTEIQKVLFLVADQYKINQQEILEKILPKWKCNLVTTYSDILKNKKMRPIDPENFCFARKPNLERCTRNRKKGIEYCASHQYNRPYGRIDEEPSQEILKKKKGVKCQVMIKVQPKVISGKQYFIDNKDHLYVSEKSGGKITYRWIGDWDESSQSIQLKKIDQETENKDKPQKKNSPKAKTTSKTTSKTKETPSKESTKSTKKEKTKTEDTKTEDTKTESTKKEETEKESTKKDKTKKEEPKTESTKTEETKKEDKKVSEENTNFQKDVKVESKDILEKKADGANIKTKKKSATKGKPKAKPKPKKETTDHE